MAELRAEGRLREETYRATRVFRVEEYEDEGPHYFVELIDGEVLYLNGQYLYDFGPPAPGVDVPAEYVFPSTSFRLLRDTQTAGVVGLQAVGGYLECDATFQGFRPAVALPPDGQILKSVGYQELLSSEGRAVSTAT